MFDLNEGRLGGFGFYPMAVKAGRSAKGISEKRGGTQRTRKRVVELSSETLFRGRVFSVARHEVVEPGEVKTVREVVHHPGSAVILPLTGKDRVLLIRQFRLAAGQFLWELPAGTLGPGETPLQTARRELEEETGYWSRRWEKLARFFPSPGLMDETMTLFAAHDIVEGTARPESDERISVRLFRRVEVLRMIRSGRICDGKTLVGLLYWHCFGEAGA